MKTTTIFTLLLLLTTSLTANAYIYVVDAHNDRLTRLNMNGSNPVELVSPLPGVPYGLSIDSANNKLYWTGNAVGSQYIGRSNLDGTNVETLYTFSGGGEFGAINPAGLVVDSAGGLIYFSDIANDKLWSAAINGGGAAQLAEQVNFRTFTGPFTGANEVYGVAAHNNTSLTFTHSMSAIEGIYNTTDGLLLEIEDPGAIAADLVSGKYFFTSFHHNAIYSMDFDGDNLATLLTGLDFVQGGGGITVNDGHIYWTEQGAVGENAVWRAELDGSNPTKLYESDGYMYGIAVVPEFQNFSLLLGLSLLSSLLLRRRSR